MPADRWNYFCLDNVAYHGHVLTIVWDRDGSHYHAGRGLSVFIDGQLKGNRHDMGKIIITNAL